MRFANCTPPSKLVEVEHEVAIAIAKVAYFISPKVVRRIAALNCAWQADFEANYGLKVHTPHFFYSSSACVFPGVRRHSSEADRKLKNSSITKLPVQFSMTTLFHVNYGAFFAPVRNIRDKTGKILVWGNLNWLMCSLTRLMK